MLRSTTRKALAAVAGVSAAATGAAVAPAPAYAQAVATDPSPGDPTPACDSWVNVTVDERPDIDGVEVIRLPSHNGSTDCTLQIDMYDNLAVVKLQDGLDKCLSPLVGPVVVDGDFTVQTHGAVKKVEDALGLPVNGVYDLEFKRNVPWPGYVLNTDGTYGSSTGSCWFL